MKSLIAFLVGTLLVMLTVSFYFPLGRNIEIAIIHSLFGGMCGIAVEKWFLRPLLFSIDITKKVKLGGLIGFLLFGAASLMVAIPLGLLLGTEAGNMIGGRFADWIKWKSDYIGDIGAWVGLVMTIVIPFLFCSSIGMWVGKKIAALSFRPPPKRL